MKLPVIAVFAVIWASKATIGDVYNAALYRNAYQSSTGNLSVYLSSHLAVDGAKKTEDHLMRLCATTKKSFHPWWTITLAKEREINELKIVSSVDFPLSDFIVQVGDCPVGCFNTCFESNGTVSNGGTIVVQCEPTPMFGKFIRIILEGSNQRVLSLCEVEVFSPGLSQNLALNQATDQSSVMSGPDLPAWLATDDLVDGNQKENGACSSTGNTSDPWWKVDLGEDVLLDQLTIYARSDCCEEPLKNFTVFAGTECADGTSYNVCYNVCMIHQENVQRNVTVNCTEPTIAKFVKIKLNNFGKLTLCEVQVWVKIDTSESETTTNADPSETTYATTASSDTTADDTGNQATASMVSADTTSSPSPAAKSTLPAGTTYIGYTTDLLDAITSSNIMTFATSATSAIIATTITPAPDWNGNRNENAETTKLTTAEISITTVLSTTDKTNNVVGDVTTSSNVVISNESGEYSAQQNTQNDLEPSSTDKFNQTEPTSAWTTQSSMDINPTSAMDVGSDLGSSDNLVHTHVYSSISALERVESHSMYLESSFGFTFFYTSVLLASDADRSTLGELSTRLEGVVLECSCVCQNVNLSISELTLYNIRHLLLNPRNVSQFRRKFYSVPDNRPSAISIGSTGILCLTFVFGLLVLSDVDYVFRKRERPGNFEKENQQETEAETDA